MEHLHALPSQLDLDDIAKHELLTYHRLHARAQNICPECSKRMRNETKLCFWCGKFFSDEGNYAWEPAEDEQGEAMAATALGLRRLPGLSARKVTPKTEQSGRIDVGTDPKAASQALSRIFGQSQEEKKAAVDRIFARLKEKGGLTDKPSLE